MSIKNMDDKDIKIMEAEIRNRRSEIEPTYQHYGSVENLSDDAIKTMKVQVLEKRNKDIPYKEYLNSLIVNPAISNNQQFEDAAVRSMESNQIMKDFTSKIVEEISEVIYEFNNIEKTDIVNVNKQKQKLENLVNVYVKYLYGLKNHGWDFGTGIDIGLDMIDGDMLNDLWQVQKEFDLTLKMPIPVDLGEDYGQAFEREGKIVFAITLMYDDLKDKEVNWHQTLIYKENELTPSQRFMQNKETAVE